MSIVSEIVREIIAEANVQKMGRRKLVRIRIRKGKVQRRRMVSNVKGFTIRGGKLVRMPQAERLRRRLSQRKAKFKRRAKLARSLIKRKRAMLKRRSLGLR